MALFSPLRLKKKLPRQPVFETNLTAAEAPIAHGATVYVSRCASCHGNVGQGVQDYPAVVGPSALSRFTTALDLAVFATQKMPPKEAARKQMTERDYWAVLSLALTANGLKLTQRVGAKSAAKIALNPQSAS